MLRSYSICYYINAAMIFSYYGMSLQNERSIVSPILYECASESDLKPGFVTTSVGASKHFYMWIS